ncbi:MAG: response regulator [Armatimonadetes bacterium]|nr:response regulator [Armatimonadota bacterium]
MSLALAGINTNKITQTILNKILIIDDESSFCEFLKENLKENGFKIDYIDKVDGILDELKRKLDYAVIIMDVKLKETNGLELIKEIKNFNPEVIFIVITGYPDLSSAIKAIREEVFNFLIKPFTLEEIEISIRNALEKYYLIKQNKILLENFKKANLKLEEMNKILNKEVINKEEELIKTKQALEERKTIEIDKGILMKRLNLSEDEAMKKLQKQSRITRTKMINLAHSIVETEKIFK